MSNLEYTPERLPGVQKKIDEYVNRIKNGESKESIFQGLPMSFRTAIDEDLVGWTPESAEQFGGNESIKNAIDKIPSKWSSLVHDPELLDEMWTMPEYIDNEKNAQMKAVKAEAILAAKAQLLQHENEQKADLLKQQQWQNDTDNLEEIRKKLGIEKPPANHEDVLSIKDRLKLNGWSASYELAKIAKKQGVDLSKISREEYVDFAIDNFLAIDDTQLRIAPWQRMGTSVEEVLLTNREKRALINNDIEKAFARFCFNIQEKARSNNRVISDGVRVRQGTKDSNSWLFFGINNGIDKKTNETYKSYISLKDLNTMTPERFTNFMIALKEAGYNGDIKIFQDLSEQGVRLNDQIVMHGGSEDDARLALDVAENFFGADLAEKSLGMDDIIDGESKSYSQILAKRIKDTIKQKSENLF
jgi:hypothetical protein